MKMVFCTLFDSFYLDKGLVMQESLEKVCKDYTLYILPMDEKCGEVLRDINLEHTIILSYDDFEDDDLKAIKNERNRAEFCWSCTAKLIAYILKKFNEPLCTYIDADMAFYDDPTVLVKEMFEDKKHVQIIKHNFRKFESKYKEKKYGKFCVEFNTFTNDEDSWEVLNQWIENCIEDCCFSEKGDSFGDQMYLNEWPQKFDCINISNNQGAGVAPWNINKFRILKSDGNYIVKDKETRQNYHLVFYHYQNIQYLSEKQVLCCSVNRDEYESIYEIYEDYLRNIDNKKRMLKEKYDINHIIKIHPAIREEYYNNTWIQLRDKLNLGIREGIEYFVDRVKNKIIYIGLDKNNKDLIVTL